MANPQCTTHDRTERWLPVVGYESFYSVSNQGRVRIEVNRPSSRLGAGDLISISRFRDSNYLRVALYADGKQRTYRVHRLVAAAFIGPLPWGQEINHKDGDPANNAASNLEYCTGFGNKQHASATGLAYRGSLNGRTELTEAQVREIRRLADNKLMSQNDIAELFNVAVQVVKRIKARQTWAHLD